MANGRCQLNALEWLMPSHNQLSVQLDNFGTIVFFRYYSARWRRNHSDVTTTPLGCGIGRILYISPPIHECRRPQPPHLLCSSNYDCMCIAFLSRLHQVTSNFIPRQNGCLIEKFAAIQPAFYIISYILSGQLYRTSDAQNVILFSLNAFIVKYASCGMDASISYLTAKV